MLDELENATEEERRRIDALRAVLIADVKARGEWREGMTVSVFCYRDVWGGVRISEIGYSTGNGGAAWMQSDLDAFPVIFAAERYLIECLFEVEDHGSGIVYDPEQEARRGLLYSLDPAHDVNALPAWEDRESNPLATEENA